MMYQNKGIMHSIALIALLSVLHDVIIDGLSSNLFIGSRFRASQRRDFFRDVFPIQDTRHAHLSRKSTSLHDSVNLSLDQHSNNNQTVLRVPVTSIVQGLAEMNTAGVETSIDSVAVKDGMNTDRRVMKLIPKVNERLRNKDYSGSMWDAICYEASAISEGDLKAASLMSNFILSQPSFEVAVIDFVANQLETPLFQATTVHNLFVEICAKNPQISSVWALDLMASAMRDNSQPNAVSVLLFNKGFHSLVTYRIANALWHEGRDGLAIYFQSLTSRVFGADIHPASTIGHGCCLSSGTGVVIGETAVIGNDCSISHDVTLGGNGKEKGDRHPKVRQSNVSSFHHLFFRKSCFIYFCPHAGRQWCLLSSWGDYNGQY